GPDGSQEVIRPFRRPEHALEEDFVLSLPDTRFGTLEDTADHPGGVVRVEATHPVEPGMADNPGSSPHGPVHGYTRRVVVGCACEAPPVLGVFPEPPAPDAAEACNRYQHFRSCALEPLVLLPLRIQLLLQPIDMSHQPRRVGLLTGTRGPSNRSSSRV